jgi:hypothetical protein
MNNTGFEDCPLPYKRSETALMDAETESKYISCFQPRVSKYVSISRDACIECHIDLFGMDKIGQVAGGMNAHTADFTALCAPEALPERIALCSYFIEYAFVHDGECSGIEFFLQVISLTALSTLRCLCGCCRRGPKCK